MSSDRRRSPRIEMLGRLHGHSVALDLAVRVREISLGGMSVETTAPLVVGSTHEFSLTLGDGATIQLTGRIVRTDPLLPGSAPLGHLSGVQFIDDDPPADEGEINDLIDRVR
ncbi:MAG: PilZ domain-containing protein [Vicinamibacterales bacterium]